MALQVDGYMRPSEVLGLRRSHVLRPALAAGPAYYHWSVVIAPQEELVTTNTGHQDDSILLGAMGDRRWLHPLLEALLDQNNDFLFEGLSLSTYEKHFRVASAALHVKQLRVTPHCVRHTGPSFDRLSGRRSLAAIKKRGRWRADASVARYEKHARTYLQWAKVPQATQRAAATAAALFPGKLLTACGRSATRSRCGLGRGKRD